MTLPIGKTRSKRPSLGAGFTLIELIVVMAMLLIVLGICFPSLKNFFRGRNLDAEARRLLSLTRYGQSRAVSEGIPMLLWVDAQDRTYGLQAQPGFLDLDRKAVEYSMDEGLTVEVSAPPATAQISNQKRALLKTANLPAIRINAEGFIEESSPETIVLHQTDYGNEHDVYISQAGSRLNYEITSTPPSQFRRN